MKEWMKGALTGVLATSAGVGAMLLFLIGKYQITGFVMFIVPVVVLVAVLMTEEGE